MTENLLSLYWDDIPTKKKEALSYADLIRLWGFSERKVRQILHELSCFDNGDNYILIRSSRDKGFYKTDEKKALQIYRDECLKKGRSLFAPVKKINRILRAECQQINFENNLRAYRESRGLKQSEVCEIMQKYDISFDKPMLSKMENNFCLPTPFQLARLAEIYNCNAADLISTDF